MMYGDIKGRALCDVIFPKYNIYQCNSYYGKQNRHRQIIKTIL